MIEKLLIGAGAMKAGTTWLYKQLEKHPDIRFTPEKEIHYFSYINGVGRALDHKIRLGKLDRVIAKGRKENVVNWYSKYALPEKTDDSWYCSLFNDTSQQVYCADFSNQYSLLPEKSLEQIQKIANDVKVIYTLRDPLARLWSHVKYHYKFIGEEDRVENISVTEFNRLISKVWFWKNVDYVSNYDRLVSVFGENNVKLYYLEDFIAFPQDSLWNLEKFLDIRHIEFKADAGGTKVNKTKDFAMPAQFEELAMRKLEPIYEALYDRNLSHPSWKGLDGQKNPSSGGFLQENKVTDDRELLEESLATLRVGLVVSFLPIGTNKSHLSVVAGFIETIACAYTNFSVMLLIANENKKFFEQGPARRREKIYTANLQKLIIEFLGTKIAENVTVKVVDDQLAPIDKSITLIDEYRPDILFFWGGNYNCRVLQQKVYKRYPVGFRFFNMKNRVDKNADIYITPRIDQQVRGPHDPTKCVYQPSVVKLYKDEHSYPFEYVKKSADEFTITTVISGERLAKAVRGYTKARLDSFFNVFNLHKNVRWVFIGPDNPDAIIVIDSRFSELIKQGRIEIINREWHLPAFYRHCDLYVHLPDIGGGGGGVNMARAEGIATLCYTGSDACTAQWPRAIYSDDSSLFSAVSYYITNDPARDELGKTVRDYMLANCSPEAVAHKLKENISRAIENYNLRVGITDKASL